MENTEDNSSIVIPPWLPVSDQNRYPAHHPNLTQITALLSPEPAPKVAIEEDRTTTQFVVSINENLPDEEEQLPESLPADALVLDSGILPAQASIDMDIDVVDHARIEEVRISNSPHAGSHHHINPKRIAYLLGMYPTFLGVVKLIKQEDHTPFTTISAVTYAIAFLVMCILAWMYEFFGNSNSSHNNVKLCWYRILQIVYYIMCCLAILFLLPLLLIPQPHH